MKKIILSALCIGVLTMVHAQVQKSKNNAGNNTSSSNTGAVVNDADYFLAVAKVAIKTGKDNKERGSSVIVRVYPAAGANNYRRGYSQENFKDELKIWSTDNFTLP